MIVEAFETVADPLWPGTHWRLGERTHVIAFEADDGSATWSAYVTDVRGERQLESEIGLCDTVREAELEGKRAAVRLYAATGFHGLTGSSEGDRGAGRGDSPGRGTGTPRRRRGTGRGRDR